MSLNKVATANLFAVSDLMREAQAITGLGDWGDDDFIFPLTVLLESIRDEANLHELGLVRAKRYVMRCLTQRLSMIEDRARRPGIAAQQIDRPVVITGFPRAGTTYLHRLLGIGGGMSSPAHWQLWTPSPPPNDPATDRDQAIQAIEAELDFQGWLSPEILRAHFHSATEPEEDFFAFEYCFVSTGFVGFFDIPSYYGKVLTGDFAPAYKWMRRVLQAVQFGLQDCRWALKAPEHMMHLPDLVAEFPDALIVQHHRDPAKIMASVFRMLTTYHQKYADNVQRLSEEGARQFVQMYAMGMANILDLRTNADFDARFLDVHFLELERDPVGSARRVYKHADVPFTAVAEANITAWIAENRKGKHGVHKYSLDDYGITAAEIRDIFSSYLKRFDVPLEGDGI